VDILNLTDPVSVYINSLHFACEGFAALMRSAIAAAPLSAAGSAAHRGMRGCRSVMGGAVAHGDVVVRTIDEKLIAIFVRSH
jgi:hypothetical protein